MKDLRSLPSIDHLLQTSACQQLLLRYGHTLSDKNTLRSQLDDYPQGWKKVLPTEEQIIIFNSVHKLSLTDKTQR